MTRGARPRFEVEKSHLMPPDAYNHWHVFDWETSQVARCPDGKLAYFPTKADAIAFAEQANKSQDPST